MGGAIATGLVMLLVGVYLFWFRGIKGGGVGAGVIGFLLIMAASTPVFPGFWPATVQLFGDVFEDLAVWAPKAFKPRT